MNNVKGWNDLVYEVAKRAKELADQNMDTLRWRHGTGGETGSMHALRQECLGMSKGDLVEAILIEDFVLDTDRDFEE